MGEKRKSYSIVMGNPEGNGPLGRTRFRWEDNTKKNLWELPT
jgi:hypothetical protein